MKTAVIPLVRVWLGLCLLLGLTLLSAELPLGPWNFALNIAFAGMKAMLIAVFYMHLRERDRLIRLFAVAGIFWLAILLGLSATDYLVRGLGVAG